MNRIDAHHHFWVYNPEEYPSMEGEEKRVLRRNYLPEDLARELTAAGIDGAIPVQARQTMEESRWLLSMAQTHDWIKGVVGWVDLCCPRVEEQLSELSQAPQFVGVRHVVQDEPDDRFMLQPAFMGGIERLKTFGLTYDILIYPRQLPSALELVRHFPDQPFVIDHLAKPQISQGRLSPWEEQMRELASMPNVWCKVSGMVTEADWTGWAYDHFVPYLDVVLDAFGPGKIMFGSDWPVCLLAARYGEVVDILERYIQQLTSPEREQVFGLNALQFYCGRER